MIVITNKSPRQLSWRSN